MSLRVRTVIVTQKALKEIVMQRSFKPFSCALMVFLGASTVAQAQFDSPSTGQPQSGSAGQSFANQSPSGESPSSPAQRVVAMVNGDQITDLELQAAVQQQAQSGQVPPEALPQVRNQTLHRLVESRLVEQHVRNAGPQVSPDEIQSVIHTYEQQLQSQGLDLQEYLASRGFTERSFQQRIHGSLAWQKYQQDKLTEENLQQHLEQNQAQFGSTELAQVRNEVIRSYVGQLWKEIVEAEAAKAKIEMLEAEQPSAPTTPPAGFPQQ